MRMNGNNNFYLPPGHPEDTLLNLNNNDQAALDEEETKRKLLDYNGLVEGDKLKKHVTIDIGDEDIDEEVSIQFEPRWPLLRCITDCKSQIRSKCVQLLGEDWILLAMMGIVMGILSFLIDVSIQKLRELHFHLFYEAAQLHPAFQYFIWVAFTLSLVLLGVAACYFISPQAVGSGIPEMKTILRGVVLKEYLTFKTLVAKVIGLVLALGSGLPLGKEGPFAHIASMVATLLGRFVASFKGAYENESRSSEMLAAACAVGVASTYGAPIGGVLFSIEVTSVFFPLRNYWRGFFAAVCSAITFRLLAVLFDELDTLAAFSPTHLPRRFPYDPKEMIAFAAMGIACGFMAASFIAFHRRYMRFIRETEWMKKILSKGHFIYPTIVVIVIASLKCPLGYGSFFAGGLTPREALDELFCNFSWNDPVVMNSSYGAVLMDHWSGEKTSIFLVLALYFFNQFWMTAVANTLPVPCGIFIPVFVTGAAFGRFCGEAMALAFPTGLRADSTTKIIPGAYAIVGATAFAGGITHAISSSVVVLEITGQMRYVLPCMLAVLLSIAVCAHFQPSIYDSTIRIKKLPYLPRIPPTSSNIHRINVSDIMIRRVHYISLETTYKQLKYVLEKMPRLRAFPLVDRPASLILLGSISRAQLETILDDQIGDDAWRFESFRKQSHFSMTTMMNTKVNSRATFSGEKAKLYQNFMRNRAELMRKAKSDEQLHQVVVRHSSISDKSRHRSGTESNNGSFSTRVSTPMLKRAKGWETRVSSVGAYVSSISNKLRQSLGFASNASGSHVSDEHLHSDERQKWEDRRLSERLDFDQLVIDPAPFQLVERTSLYKVHMLFSLLGLNRAYATCLGRLVGVVALRELRAALEKAQIDGKDSNQDGSKRSSDSTSSHDPVPGTSIASGHITPAEVVRKISGLVPPPVPYERLEIATTQESVFAPQQSESRTSEDFTSGPSAYFYTAPPKKSSGAELNL